MGKFRVLSLDGGGIRGAFSASFLAEIERSVGQPLGQYFDLIVGTSTGGIVATALALGETAQSVSQLYQDEGARIFTRRAPSSGALGNRLYRFLAWLLRPFLDRRLSAHDMDMNCLIEARYEPDHLQAVLRATFGDRTLGDARTRLALPVVDLSAGRVVVLKTPHLPHAASRDHEYGAVEAVLSATAAPTYFPHASPRPGSALCDGGLWANNPSMVAYAEAMKIREVCTRSDDPRFEHSEILMLSVGTGEAVYSLAPPRKGAGLVWWGPRLVDVTLLSQAQGTQCLANYLLGPGQHHRINYTIPDPTWKLDNVNHLATLLHYGNRAAHEHISRLEPLFFDEPACPFVPFGTRITRSPLAPAVQAVAS